MMQGGTQNAFLPAGTNAEIELTSSQETRGPWRRTKVFWPETWFVRNYLSVPEPERALAGCRCMTGLLVFATSQEDGQRKYILGLLHFLSTEHLVARTFFSVLSCRVRLSILNLHKHVRVAQGSRFKMFTGVVLSLCALENHVISQHVSQNPSRRT